MGTVSVVGNAISGPVMVEWQRGSHVATTAEATIPRSGPSAGSVLFDEALSLSCTMFSNGSSDTFQPKSAAFKLRAGRRLIGTCKVDLAMLAALTEPKTFALNLKRSNKSIGMLSIRMMSARCAGEADVDRDSDGSDESDASTVASDASAFSDVGNLDDVSRADVRVPHGALALSRGPDSTLLNTLYSTRPDVQASHEATLALPPPPWDSAAECRRLRTENDSLRAQLVAACTSQNHAEARAAELQATFERDLHGLIGLRLELAEAKERIAELENAQRAAAQGKPRRR